MLNILNILKRLKHLGPTHAAWTLKWTTTCQQIINHGIYQHQGNHHSKQYKYSSHIIHINQKSSSQH